MHPGDSSAQASKIEPEIVTGMERGEALIQSRERRASFCRVGAGWEESGCLQLGSQFLFDVAAAAVRFHGSLIFLHPLDGIQRMRSVRSFLRRFGRTGAGGPLRGGVVRADCQESRQAQGYDRNFKKIPFHIYLVEVFLECAER